MIRSDLETRFPVSILLALTMLALGVFERHDLVVLLGLVMSGVALACVAGALYRRRRSLALVRANSLPRGEPPLLDRQVITLGGRVEFEANHDVALRVEIEQEGREHRSWGSWYHSWTEVRRTVTAVPFFLVTESGERVRVVPAESTQLLQNFACPNEKKNAPHLRPRRLRIATIEQGEQIRVTGQLGDTPGSDLAPPADYRASALPEGRTMHAPPVLVVASERLVDHQRERASVHGRHALVYAAIAVLSLLPPLGWADRALGHTEEGRVLEAHTSHGRMTGKNGVSTPYTSHWARIEIPSGFYEDNTRSLLSKDESVLVRRGRFSSNLGGGAASSQDEGISSLMMGFALLMAQIWFVSTEKENRSWYRRPGKPFVETFPGRLP